MGQSRSVELISETETLIEEYADLVLPKGYEVYTYTKTDSQGRLWDVSGSGQTLIREYSRLYSVNRPVIAKMHGNKSRLENSDEDSIITFTNVRKIELERVYVVDSYQDSTEHIIIVGDY